MILITEENYKNYGKCISLSTNDIKMLISVDLGPRILFYGIDGKNILFNDIEDTTNKGGEFFDKNLKGEGIWHLYGGHRLWKSPEYMDTYYPDNKEVEVVKVNENTLRFISKIETTTGLQKIIQVTMNEDGSCKIQQEIHNKSTKKTTPISAWGLTVLDKGTIATIPLDQSDTGFLPNKNIVFWSYSDVNDERLKVYQDKIVITQKNIENPIKIGTYTNKSITALVNGMEFNLSVDEKEGYYPDFHSNIECYTNHIIFEIETLSPLSELDVNEAIIHTENWSLKRG